MSGKPCILWTGSVGANGYGRRTFQGKKQQAHRVAFFEAYGWWPPVVMHTCDTPLCIEPSHLMGGTVQDNNEDRKQKGRGTKTHCVHGHEFSGANTKVWGGRRYCLTCERVRHRGRV